MIVVRCCHDIGVGAEEIYADGSFLFSPSRWHEVEERLNQLLGLGVIKDFNTLVIALPLNASAVCNSDCLVFRELWPGIRPCVVDDVPGPLAVHAASHRRRDGARRR